jgi:hypothetical protein
MTRYRELVELRARTIAVLATMEKVAGAAPDFVRRFDRSGMRDDPPFSSIYAGLKALYDQALDEANTIQREGGQ